MPQWEPFAGIGSLQREINQLLEAFLEGGAPWHKEKDAYKPAAEVTDTPEALVVRLQVPGVTRDELQLTVTSNSLTVRGNLQEMPESSNVYRREFRYGAFSRTIALPVPVQEQQATAQLKDGILTITLPKSVPSQGHDIPIQS